MLNSLKDGQINYGTTNCPSAHVPPHNVVAPIHQNSLISTEPTTSVVYPWNSNPQHDHFYGFHSRYYNLDFSAPYPPATNQYAPANIYGQNVPPCCQPCCRFRPQNIPKTSPQVLYNPIRPVHQVNRSYKSKKTLKTSCSEQFLPYIPNDLPIKYDTQNCYQQKYNNSYLNNASYCPPANNLWMPPAANPSWSVDRLRPLNPHTGGVSHDFNRDKSYQRLPNFQSNPYTNSSSSTHHRPYNYIPPIPDVHDYSSSIYHNSIKNSTSEYLPREHNSRLPISSQNNQSLSPLQQYYDVQPVAYSDIQRPGEPFKSPQITPQNSSKSNLNVREFLATWDEGEEENSEKLSETTAPIVVLDCMTLEGDALSKIQEKLNVVSYENLEKVLKENHNPLVINTESNEIDSVQNKTKLSSKSNFEPLDYTKRETGIIKPFITDKKMSSETNNQSEKNYSVNFDGMVAWYGKKNTDISSTDLIERLADRIFNLSKSQENEGVSFGTAAYTGQLTQTNRSIESSIYKNSLKYAQNQQMFDLDQTEKCIESSVINKIDSTPKIHSCVLNESNKVSNIKSNNINSSCIVENITKKCLNDTSEQTTPWNLDQGSQEQHLNMSLYDHSVIIKPIDFSSLTDETKNNPFVFEKNTSSSDKSNSSISDQYDKVLNENNSYNSVISNDQHSKQQIDSCNRNFPVIVSPNIHRQEYNGFHESVIQRTGCDKNKHDKVSTQTDFESINWNISNDLDKIMKNNMTMESSCLYDRNNYNILDSLNSDKNVPNQWKDNVPCVDLTVNSKTHSNHDSFFDGWNFIESYENNTSKKNINTQSNNNEAHNPLFSTRMNYLEKLNNKSNNSHEKVENEKLVTLNDNMSFSKSNDLACNNSRSRDVFNLNNGIPDFSDGFELPVIHEPHEYLQFKKSSNDNEHRTDGSIFEHLTEPKCIRSINDTTYIKNEQNKPDIVGLPSFKEKDPLAPMPMPPKLNVVKPIIRDPSQMYTVIKQKLKYDNTCVDNDNASNKTVNNLRGNQTNTFNEMDLKSKYNNMQLNHFDVWSEKFILKENTNNLSSTVVQCDVEITQVKNTENKNALTPKSNINEDYQEQNAKLLKNTNCNLTEKINEIENNKINSNDFLNCLESTKPDDQKYRDTLDEFETSFGFDIHCNNESNKSFHENIVDKCLEERIKDQISEHNMNTSELTKTSNNNLTQSNNTELSFQCEFQSDYLIKNYYDENKNKAVISDEKLISNHEKLGTSVFNYHNEIEHDFELQNSNHNRAIDECSKKNSNLNILNNVNHNIERIQCNTEDNNYKDQKTSNSFKSNHENTVVNEISNVQKIENFGYLSTENNNFELKNNKDKILESGSFKEIMGINNSSKTNDICEIDHCNSIIQKKSNMNVDFELNVSKSNIFKNSLKTTNTEIITQIEENHELKNNDNEFDSTFHCNDLENVEHRINNKNIFELRNNDMYQTKNVDKMHEFDFQTRIIQHFDIDCSNSNVQKPTSPKEILKNEHKMKTSCNYELSDEKNITYIHEKSQNEKTSNLNSNSHTQIHNIIEPENSNQENKIDCIFEVGGITNNIQEKPKSNIHTEFDIQNENIKIDTLNNHNTYENSNRNNNVEVEHIFDNLYNLTSLNTGKVYSNISESCCQSDNQCNVFNSLRHTKDRNVNLIKTIDKDCEEIKSNKSGRNITSDKTFGEADHVLLLDFVNNSTSHLTTESIHQKELSHKEKNEELISGVYNTNVSNECILNKNEHILDISSKIILCKNIVSFEEQSKDVKQSEIESINPNIIQTNTVQGTATKTGLENIKVDLLNVVQSIDKTYDEKHTENNNSEHNSLNHVELTYQYPNEIVEVENSNKLIPSLLNQVELKRQKHHNDIEIEDSIDFNISSLNHIKLTHQRHSNNIIETEDLSKSVPSLSNPDVLTHQLSIDIVEDSIKPDLDLLNHNELSHLQQSDKIFEARDLSKSVSSSLNNIELTHELSKNIVRIENATNSDVDSLNHAKSTQHSDDIVETVNLPKSVPSSLNHVKLSDQHSNDNFGIGDSSESNADSLNPIETTQHSEDLSKSIASVNHFSNDIVGIEDAISSDLYLLNHVKSTQHSDDNVKTGDLSESVSNSLNYIKLSDKLSNDLIGIKDSSESDLDLLNPVESTQHSDYIVEAKDLSKSVPSLLNHVKLSHQLSNDIYEIEDSTESDLDSLNRTELTHKQLIDKIDKTKDLTDFKHNSNNSCNEMLPYQQNSYEIVKDPTSLASLSLTKNKILKPNYDSYFNKKNSENIISNIKLPKVKFTLKNRYQSIIKTNIFDDEPIVSYKKTNLVKEKTFIGRHIFKPWRRLYNRELTDEPIKNLKETVETISSSMDNSPNNISQKIKPIIVDIKELKDNKDVSLIDSSRKLYVDNLKHVGNKEIDTFDDDHSYKPFTYEENTPMPSPINDFESEKIVDIKELKDNKDVSLIDSSRKLYVDNLKHVGNKEIDTFDDDDHSYKPFTYEENTPMPSPINDFESENQMSENDDGQEYWDKSLENEYKNVLHKTISKLSKNRVNIRDKFNTRLLARRTNETKRRKRQLRPNKMRLQIVDDNLAGKLGDVITTVKMPVTVLRLNTTTAAVKTKNPKCMIKVQLPWCRIFNLNNQKAKDPQKTMDTKLELGPAKVEVRMSRTPGEWQVAACQSMMSSKSVVSVRRLVLQKAISTVKGDGNDNGVNNDCCSSGTNNCSNGGDGSSMSDENSRKLPKIVIRRNGEDNNYVSYVSGNKLEGGDNNDGSPRLIVRLVRDRNLDAMAVDGVTTLNLKHLVPISESTEDAHDAKRARYM